MTLIHFIASINKLTRSHNHCFFPLRNPQETLFSTLSYSLHSFLCVLHRLHSDLAVFYKKVDSCRTTNRSEVLSQEGIRNPNYPKFEMRFANISNSRRIFLNKHFFNSKNLGRETFYIVPSGRYLILSSTRGGAVGLVYVGPSAHVFFSSKSGDTFSPSLQEHIKATCLLIISPILQLLVIIVLWVICVICGILFFDFMLFT